MKTQTYLLLALLLFASLISCKNPPDSNVNNESRNVGAVEPAVSNDMKMIRDLILSVPKIDVKNPSAEPDGDIIAPKTSVGFIGSGANRLEIFEEKRKLTKTLEKYVAFNPNVDSLYPGALIQGKSLPDGVLTPIQVPRTPLTITISDFISSNPSATYSQDVKQPTLAGVTGAVNSILNQTLQKDQPSRISYSET
jgi:hypothetical protein